MTGKLYHNKKETNAQDKKNSSFHTHPLDVNKCIHFEQIDSTNTWAKTHLDQWAPQGMTRITASAQTAGRGRFQRHWESPAHVNIYATFCFWFDSQRRDRGHLPQLLTLAAAHTLETIGFACTIKWPNDLLLNGKKIAGILCETIMEKERCGVVCGIGMNINMNSDDLQKVERPATSLWIESHQRFDVADILTTLQHLFISYLDEFIQKGFSSFFPLLQKRLAFKKGQTVCFHDHQTLVEAQFVDLHEDGSVELLLPDGTAKIYYVGEFC